MKKHVKNLSLGILCIGAFGCASGPLYEERTQQAPLAEQYQPEVSADSQGPQKGKVSKDPAKTVNMEASAEYHFSMAQAYVAEGNTDRAIEEYKLTLMFDPNSSLVYARLAGEYIKKGMLSAAMEACKEALQRDPNFTDARLLLAGLYSSSRDSDSAVAEYDRILKAHPRHDEAAVYKAQVLIEDGHQEAAVHSLRNFVKKNPDSAVAHFYLGKAEQGMQHFKEAESAFRKAIDIRSSFSQASLALGMLYEERKMNPQAIATYKELYESSQDMTAAERLVTIYLKEEKYNQAMPYLRVLSASDPDDLNSRVKLGLVQMELKQYEEAIATFNAILQKSPDAERVHYYLGSIYEELKQTGQAIVELKKISPDSKLYPESALHVAFLMKQEGKIKELKTYIQDCIQKAPNFANFYIFQASLEEEGKNPVAAVRVLEGAVKRFGEDERIRYYLGSLYDHQGEVTKGLEQMEAILKINPNNVDALNYVGYTWTNQGVRLNEAEILLKRAMGLSPDNGYVKDSWGWHLFVRGRVDEAVVELEKAVSLSPNEATILEHLADAYLRSNFPEKALARYRDAVKYASNEEIKKKLEEKLNNVQTVLAKKGIGLENSAPERMPAAKGKQ